MNLTEEIKRLHPISPKVRKFEGSWVRRFFSPKVRKLEKKVLESERKGSVVRRSMIPKSWNMHFFSKKYSFVTW